MEESENCTLNCYRQLRTHWQILAMSGPQCFENPPSLSSGTNGEGTVFGKLQIKGHQRDSWLLFLMFCMVTTLIQTILNLIVSWKNAHGMDKGCEDTKPLIAVLKSKGVTAIGDAGFCWGGYEAPNLRKLADKVAATGYYVVVPDFLYGDPFTPDDASRPQPVWLKDHEPSKAFEDAKPVIEALKSKGVLAIGAASFCWGAKCVVELAKSGMIQAAVLFHPSFITLDDIKGVNIPIAVLGAEIDKYCPPELVKQFEQVLTAKLGVDCYVKVFPKVSHGWTVRYDIEDAAAVMAAEAAHQNLLDWFAKHVK